MIFVNLRCKGMIYIGIKQVILNKNK